MNNRKAGLILAYTETALSAICGIFLSSFLLRQLGDYEYGLYQTVSAFIGALAVLELGTGTVTARNLLVVKDSDDPEAIKKVTSTLWYITVLAALIITLAGAVLLLAIGALYRDSIGADGTAYAQRIFLLMLVYLLTSLFSQTLSGTYIANENYFTGNAVNIIRILLRTSMLLLLVTFRPSATAIALCDAVLGVGVLIFSFVYVRKKYIFSFDIRHFDKSVLKESLPLCAALFMQALIAQTNTNVDKFIISIKLNMEAVSVYSVAVYIYTVFSSVSSKPIAFYLPQTAKSIQNGKSGKELTDDLIPSGRLVALVGGTVLFGFVSVGRPFISILYGKDFIYAWICALVLLVPTFVNMTGGSVINVLDIQNKRHIRSFILALTTLINIVLTVIFIDVWGMVGAAVATAVSLTAGQLTLLNIYYYKAFSINVWRIYLKSYEGILPALVSASAVGIVVSVCFESAYAAFVFGGAAYIITEIAMLMLFGLKREEKKKLSLILSRCCKERKIT